MSEVMGDVLEQVARQGACRLLAEMLEAEVTEFLQRVRYERAGEFRGYRNGNAPERTIGVGLGAVAVRMPRVCDVPKAVAPDGFASQIVGRYQPVSKTTQRLLAQVYLEGLSTGDFEPVFRTLLGETAPLSPASVVRLKAEWQQEYDAWRTRRLDGRRYLYLWVDGVYLRAGQEDEATAVLVVIGLRDDGGKELPALELSCRESAENWATGRAPKAGRGSCAPCGTAG